MSKLTHHWNPRLSASTYASEADCGVRDPGGTIHDQSLDHVTCAACLLTLSQRVRTQADDLLDTINKRIEELTKEEA
jgi:hypothetical protein